MKQLKEIPKNMTEDESFEFWSTHDSTEYLDPKKFKRVPAYVPRTDGMHVQMAPEMEREVQRLSRERKIDVQEMIRQLLAAGLKQQRPQPGA